MDVEQDFPHERRRDVSHVGQGRLLGTPDEVIEQAAQWRDCGVRHMVLFNLSIAQRMMSFIGRA
jgi:phthiodiolone/phenolphthiodiolone dimycocerosates ketoreductase